MSRLAQPLGRLLDADHGDWTAVLQSWREGAAGQALLAAVDARVAQGCVVYPGQVFRAFELTPMSRTRVVVLGQDPYHGAGQAEGLAFSVPPGQRLPPSLRNIFKELHRDLGLPLPTMGSLVPWADQGVLLLNAALTVEAGRPGAHAKLGWQALTDKVCDVLAADEMPKVFMLWGSHAQARAQRVRALGERHLVLECNHPSPLSATRPPRPFIGCGHFGEANRFLVRAGRGAVAWALS